jgi:xanthine dehydrogenase accessory factor
MQAGNVQAVSASGLLAAEDIWPAMQCYADDGQRTALVTLVGVDGVAPRAIGAQLAVAEDGRHFGYLSGGCIEQSIARQAVEQIKYGQNLLERYGRGSRYFDIRLPCGSGLDLYFDCSIWRDEVTAIRMLQDQRQPFVIHSDLTPGGNARSNIARLSGPLGTARTQRDGQTFSRLHTPNLQLFVIGNGPAASGIAELACSAGFTVKVWTNDGGVQDELALHHVEVQDAASRATALITSADAFTAVVFAFHDHDIEIPMIMDSLSGHSF